MRSTMLSIGVVAAILVCGVGSATHAQSPEALGGSGAQSQPVDPAPERATAEESPRIFNKGVLVTLKNDQSHSIFVRHWDANRYSWGPVREMTQGACVDYSGDFVHFDDVELRIFRSYASAEAGTNYLELDAENNLTTSPLISVNWVPEYFAVHEQHMFKSAEFGESGRYADVWAYRHGDTKHHKKFEVHLDSISW